MRADTKAKVIKRVIPITIHLTQCVGNRKKNTLTASGRIKDSWVFGTDIRVRAVLVS
jgi:hypothetical protein